MATTQEQIDAILSKRTVELVMRETGKPGACFEDTCAVFTIKKKTVINWIKKNGIPESACYSKSGKKDGIYLVDTELGSELYYQERETKHDEQMFPNKQKAIKPLVEMILQYSAMKLK